MQESLTEFQKHLTFHPEKMTKKFLIFLILSLNSAYAFNAELRGVGLRAVFPGEEDDTWGCIDDEDVALAERQYTFMRDGKAKAFVVRAKDVAASETRFGEDELKKVYADFLTEGDDLSPREFTTFLGVRACRFRVNDKKHDTKLSVLFFYTENARIEVIMSLTGGSSPDDDAEFSSILKSLKWISKK